jgi:thiol-disulfide isomerase/thioredoxin
MTAIASLGLTLASLPATAVEPGAPAPSFDLPKAEGAVRLGDLRGKVVYLDFWASWCGPCKQSFPWLNDMQSKYRAQGLEVVAVNLDAKGEDARRFLAETPAAFTVAFDAAGATPKAYAIKGMPSSVLIGADGKVIAQHAGFREGDRDKLEEQIRVALGARK